MKVALIAIISALAVVSTVVYVSSETTTVKNIPTPVYDAWVHWKQSQGKSYGNNSEEEYRMGVFNVNFNTVSEFNSKQTTSSLALNKFADLTSEEFAKTYTGLNKQVLRSPKNVMTFETANLKSEVNWVTKGAVAAVKDQGQCGSCWAFSAVSSTETANYLKHGSSSVATFSEQQLVDCAGSYGNNGCQGGLMDHAFDYIKDHSLDSMADYAYTGRNGSCKASGSGNGTVTAYTDVRSGSPDQLRAALNQQTVSVAIEADQSVFQFYNTGVITSSSCGQQLDHGVTAVGYGTEGGEEYFLVRNSWGPSWGASGYVKIGASSENICGILSQPSYPTA